MIKCNSQERHPWRPNRREFVGSVLAAAVARGALAQSAAYPTQPVKIIVPWPAGGGSDVVTRRLVPGLTKRLGQAVIIENRPGAAGTIGHMLAAKAPADGHTLLYSSVDTFAITTQLLKVQFDPRKDFVPIASIGNYPLGLVVAAGHPARDLKHFIEIARASKEPISYASNGPGTPSHILFEAFAKMAGFQVLHVPFQGAAPGMQALLGKQVMATLAQVVSADGYVRSGTARLLGVTSKERLPTFPDVPNFAEQGVPLEVSSWAGILAPVGTPAAIVSKLHSAIVETQKEPEVVESFRSFSGFSDLRSQPEFNKFVLAEYDRWGKFIRDNKITIQN